jgi:Domain of unknown function (DUF4365)
MITSFPQRPDSHQLEELSERFFQQCLPKNWTMEKPKNDYGVDLRVDIFEESNATGREMVIQLKASAQASSSDNEPVQLKVATYNLLWSKLQVAMLVKYIEAENEAYWLLFKDIPQPNQDHETFTVHLPRVNRLSQIDWTDIAAHVKWNTDGKLAPMRANQVTGGFVCLHYVPNDEGQQ